MKKYLIFSFLFLTFGIVSCGGGNKGNALQIPLAPANLTAVAGDAQVRLTWDASSGAASYNVYYRLFSDSSFVKIAATPITGDTVAGLVSGETYYFMVTAVNSAGTSGYSNQTGVTLVSGAPTDLAAVAGDQQVSLTWNATIGAARYNVYSANSPGGPYTEVASTANAHFAVAGLTNGMTYYFVVTAVNTSGESAYSNEISIIPELAKVYSSGGIAPLYIAIDSSSNIWVTNISSGTVTKMTPSGITIGTYEAGSGPGDLAIDHAGNVWVSNPSTDTVAELSSTGITIGTYNAGSGSGRIAIDASGDIWVVDSDISAVTELDSLGSPIATYTVGTTPSFLVGIAIDGSNNVWVTDDIAMTVSELSFTGMTVGVYAAESMPLSLAIDKSENVWIVNNSTSTVTELNSLGEIIGIYRVGVSPEDIAIDASGNVWVTNFWSSTVTEISHTGAATKKYTVGINPVGIAIDSAGNVWVANYGDNTVTELVGAATGPQYFPYTGPQWP